ncbi:MAG TPA: hypothetical protein VLC52_00315 [Anaerolineae bacterium]|nr:hypothetical protein [Anaerolineae bacterium]
MGSEYPDILGDLVEARQRFEVNGVHYLLALESPAIAPGEATALRVWLQSCWDVPMQVSVGLRFPGQRVPTFSLAQARTDVPLEAAEVGELTIPIAAGVQTEAGVYRVEATLSATGESRGLYVRSQKSAGQLGESLLTFRSGMKLAASLGLGFVSRTQGEQVLSLEIAGQPRPGPAPDLTPTYMPHWTVADLALAGKARRYVNDQRIDIVPRLKRHALYVTFLEESQVRFRNAGLPLHIGEALFLAKILTHTVEYFLQTPAWQDAILVPAYTLAYHFDLPISDPVLLVARADYARLVRLAASLSFGLLRQRLSSDPWTMEEQVAVAGLVSNRAEQGGLLPAEFLYLPLVLGGLLVADRVLMPGEQLSQSLGLLAQARQKRKDELQENPELVAVLDRLLDDASPGGRG